MAESRAELLRLSDTDLVLEDPAADIRGRTVYDTHGEEVGTVNDLMIDAVEHKVRFLRVTSGGFLGLGASEILIPVDAITRIDADTVYINPSRERIAAAPAYDPEVVDDAYLDRLYSHYGYGPYWAAGYDYPNYPYYGRREG